MKLTKKMIHLKKIWKKGGRPKGRKSYKKDDLYEKANTLKQMYTRTRKKIEKREYYKERKSSFRDAEGVWANSLLGIFEGTPYPMKCSHYRISASRGKRIQHCDSRPTGFHSFLGSRSNYDIGNIGEKMCEEFLKANKIPFKREFFGTMEKAEVICAKLDFVADFPMGLTVIEVKVVDEDTFNPICLPEKSHVWQLWQGMEVVRASYGILIYYRIKKETEQKVEAVRIGEVFCQRKISLFSQPYVETLAQSYIPFLREIYSLHGHDLTLKEVELVKKLFGAIPKWKIPCNFKNLKEKNQARVVDPICYQFLPETAVLNNPNKEERKQLREQKESREHIQTTKNEVWNLPLDKDTLHWLAMKYVKRTDNRIQWKMKRTTK